MADDLVPVTNPAALAKPGDSLPEWIGLSNQLSLSTFDSKTDSGLRLMSKVSLGCDKIIQDHINETIDIESWFMSPYEKLDERTGEINQLVYVAIVAADGMTYSCSSMGIRKSLLMLAREFGFKPWVPAVRVKVRSVKAKMGHMFALEFLNRCDPAQQPKKGKV